MEYFRCNIIKIITTALIMVVSVHSGMFEYILDTQTSPTMNLEEVLHLNTTECEDTENESNDECCLRRAKKHLSRITTSHFANINFSHFIKRQTEHTATHIPYFSKTSRHLSALFCTFII